MCHTCPIHVWPREDSVCRRHINISEQACRFKECNRGHPPPGALSELNHVNGGAARAAAAACAALAHWLPPMAPLALSDNNPGKWGITHTHTHTATLHQHKCQAFVLCLWLKLHSAVGIKEEVKQKRISSPPVEFQIIYSSCHFPAFTQVQDEQRTTGILLPKISFSSRWRVPNSSTQDDDIRLLRCRTNTSRRKRQSLLAHKTKQCNRSCWEHLVYLLKLMNQCVAALLKLHSLTLRHLRAVQQAQKHISPHQSKQLPVYTSSGQNLESCFCQPDRCKSNIHSARQRKI